jgi:hypothetical protein
MKYSLKITAKNWGKRFVKTKENIVPEKEREEVERIRGFSWWDVVTY